jgi:hypothetical protein
VPQLRAKQRDYMNLKYKKFAPAILEVVVGLLCNCSDDCQGSGRVPGIYDPTNTPNITCRLHTYQSYAGFIWQAVYASNGRLERIQSPDSGTLAEFVYGTQGRVSRMLEGTDHTAYLL